MNCYTRKQIENAMIAKGYRYFTSGDYNLNIVGNKCVDIENQFNSIRCYYKRATDCIMTRHSNDPYERFGYDMDDITDIMKTADTIYRAVY